MMLRSLAVIPRRVRAVLAVGILVVSIGITRGCVLVIETVQHPPTVAVVEQAVLTGHWIIVDLTISRPRDCPSQATQFLRRKTSDGFLDLMPINVTNTTISDAGAGKQLIHLWFAKPAYFEETGQGWGYWNKAQDDCGVLAWLTTPPTRESDADVGHDMPLVVHDQIRGDIGSPFQFAQTP